jgi:hypothetical protein
LNEAILHETRTWTVLAGAATAVVCGFAISWNFSLGLGLTVLWAVAGFFTLEKLLRSLVVAPGQRRRLWTGLCWLAAKLALYGLALWGLLERRFPPLSHVLGLTLLLIVLVAVGATQGSRGGAQPERQGDDG